VQKGQQIGAFGSPAENGGWAPHTHFQIMSHLMGLSGNFPGVGEPSLVPVWRRICLDPNLILGLTAEILTPPPKRRGELLADRRRLLGPSLSLSYAEPLEIVRGEGVWLYDQRGRAFLDCVNNICHVGHCHPAVVNAMSEQAARLNTNTRYLHETILAYAERLARTMPDPLGVCFFVCSGSEANELAMRMARAYTDRQDAVVLANAYHGNTATLVDHSPYKCEGRGGRGLPSWVRKVPMPDPYRGPYRGLDEATGKRYAETVEAVVRDMERDGKPPAFFIAESILGVAGQVVLPQGYLAGASGAIREAGGLYIADEVQVGFGRVGSHMWAFETQDVVPDIVTLGKPIGNGHPMGCVVTRPEIAEAFANGMEYFNSFGGNPVSCAVGMAVLDVIEKEGLRQNAAEVGAYLMNRLKGLWKSSPLIGDVRGLGLFVGLELVRDRESLEPATSEATAIVNAAKEKGVLLSTDGPHENVIKMKPPIVFSRENADLLADTLEEVMSCLSGKPSRSRIPGARKASR
jgi:4-aminobutyrate aminotransferase-like enzyme